jgi:hypothetical protein
VGAINFDGNGKLTIRQDASRPAGLSEDEDLAGAYAINADGSGTLAGHPLVTNGKRTFFIDNRPEAVFPMVSTIVK